MAKIKLVLRYVLGVLFFLAGANHFVSAAVYVKIMPSYLPWHLALVYVSGVAEMVLGALLLTKRWQKWAAWGLVALLMAVFPANINMLLHPELFPKVPVWALWLRLPLQGVLVAWAYWYTRDE